MLIAVLCAAPNSGYTLPKMDVSAEIASKKKSSKKKKRQKQNITLQEIVDTTQKLVTSDTLKQILTDSTTITKGKHKPKTADNLIKDSLRTGTFKSDTLFIKGGVLPTMREKFIDEQSRIAGLYDTTAYKTFKEKNKERLLGDTLNSMSFGTLTGLSFIAPGFGQIHNKQYWKLPILYAATGTFLYLSIRSSKEFKKYNNAYENALKIGVSQDKVENLQRKRNSLSTQKTLFYAGTALTYLYFVGDAAINYKGAVHPTRKATILSAIFPGAGQVYNKSYWKLPIIYGGLATFGYIVDYNNRGYQRYKKAYTDLTDGDESTVDIFNGRYSESYLQNTRDSYRRYRDLGIIMTCAFYLLNIVDAHVEAYLRRYDISDDLAMRVEPTIIQRSNTSSRSSNEGIGLSMKFKF